MICNAMHRSGVNRCWLREEMIFESSRMLVVGTLRKKMGRRGKRWKKMGEKRQKMVGLPAAGPGVTWECSLAGIWCRSAPNMLVGHHFVSLTIRYFHISRFDDNNHQEDNGDMMIAWHDGNQTIWKSLSPGRWWCCCSLPRCCSRSAGSEAEEGEISLTISPSYLLTISPSDHLTIWPYDHFLCFSPLRICIPWKAMPGRRRPLDMRIASRIVLSPVWEQGCK